VFEKVRRAVVLGGFVARSSVDPHADRGGFGPHDGFGGDAEAGGEGGDVGGGSAEDVVGERWGGGGSGSGLGAKEAGGLGCGSTLDALIDCNTQSHDLICQLLSFFLFLKFK